MCCIESTDFRTTISGLLTVDDIDERLQSAIAALPAKMGEWFVEQLKIINLIGVNMKVRACALISYLSICYRRSFCRHY